MQKIIGIDISRVEKFIRKPYAQVSRVVKRSVPARVTLQSFLISRDSVETRRDACELRIGDDRAYGQNNPPEVGDIVFQDSTGEEALRDGWYQIDRREAIQVESGRIAQKERC